MTYTQYEAWSYLFKQWILNPWRFRLWGISLSPQDRYVGPKTIWYDGMHWSFGCWFGHFGMEEEP